MAEDKGTFVTVLTEQQLRALVAAAVSEALRPGTENGCGQCGGKEEEILTMDRLCELLGLSKATVYSYTSKNFIPHFRRGKHLFFRRSCILKWLEDGRVPTRAEAVRGVKGLLGR